jgi:hypothetical protein
MRVLQRFSALEALNGDADVHNLIAEMGVDLDNDTVSKVMELYPDDPAQGCPFNTVLNALQTKFMLAVDILHNTTRLNCHIQRTRPTAIVSTNHLGMALRS